MNLKSSINIKMVRTAILLSLILFQAGKTEMKAATQSDSTLKYSIKETIVTGTRDETDIRHLPMTVSSIDRKGLEESHQQSVLPVLNARIPGLFSTSRGIMGYGVSDGSAGNISIRGIGSSTQAGVPTTGVLILIDGHPQYMGLMGHPVADAYQTMMAERIEVLRGPASVLYGSNAMGGVINIVTRKMQEDGIRTGINAAAGSYGTVRTEITSRIRKGGFSSIVSGSYGRTDGHRKDTDFSQYGGYVKIGYDFRKNWKISADANVTHFNASQPGAVTQPMLDADQRITRGMASAAVENSYGKTSGTLSLFYNWGDHWINDGYTADPDDSSTPKDYRFLSHDDMAGISLYQSVSLFKGNRITFGADFFLFGGRAWNRYVEGERKGETEAIADKRLSEIAGYMDFRQDLWKFMTFDAGLRIDRHSRTGTELIPQAGLAFRLPANAEIKLVSGKGFRNPTIKEMYMFPPQNPDLEPERIWSHELSYSQKFLEGRLAYGINLFYIKGDNLILKLPNPGGSGMINLNSGAVRNFGAEAEISCVIDDTWSVYANYSWLKMKNPLIGSPEHKLYAGADFRKGRWKASTGLQYISGLYTRTVPDIKENYLLWDLQCDFRITGWLSLFVKGENLLGWKYEVMSGYPMPEATVLSGIEIEF